MNIFETHPLPWEVGKDGRFLYDGNGCAMFRLSGEGMAEAFEALLQRIAELEAEQSDLQARFNTLASVDDITNQNPFETISKAIHFFTGKSVSESDISDWSNGIDPTAPEEQ